MKSPRKDVDRSLLSRRDLLARAGAGAGVLGLASLLAEEGLLGGEVDASTRARELTPHRAGATARSRQGARCDLDLHQRRTESGRHLGPQT